MGDAQAASLGALPFLSAGERPRPSETATLTIGPGETVADALLRTGADPADAARAAGALAAAMAPGPADGVIYAALVPAQSFGEAHLTGVSFHADAAALVTAAPSSDGVWRVNAVQEPIRSETAVAAGVVRGSLYSSAIWAGADPTAIGEALSLFSRRLDFARDLDQGDNFRLVFDRQTTESGRAVAPGALLYAELDASDGPVRFYRFERNGQTQWFDAMGRDMRGFLLRTPVDGARVTSGFGMRLHPILGYSRMHQGVDFGASMGTPVYAAGDGVVAEAGWRGGYGNWVRVTHQGGWDTGYGHLSAYAPGVRPGIAVRQGQVIAYVGSTGQSTGPHLHYEIWRNGERLNPLAVRPAEGVQLRGAELAAFAARRARVDAVLAEAPPSTGSAPTQAAAAPLRRSLAALPPRARAG